MGHTLEHNHHCEEGHHAMRHFLPLLAVPVAIGVLRGMARRRHMFMHMGRHGREGWENGVPPFFAEWHRRAHEAPQTPAEPAVKES